MRPVVVVVYQFIFQPTVSNHSALLQTTF